MNWIPNSIALTVLSLVSVAASGAPLASAASGATLGDVDGHDHSTSVADTGTVEMLRLRGGRIEWGTIRSHDPDGFDFVLLSNAGEVRVSWDLLDPAQESELRERYGYVDVSSDELTIEVERIQLREGGEVIGRILSRDGKNFVVKVGGNLQSIPKDRVLSVSSGINIPILDVFSREEVYAYLTSSLVAADPDSQRDLAQNCERILDFDRAVEHYQRALDLYGEPREDVSFALERAREKASQQEQIDYIRQADQLRKRGRYDEALTWINNFGGAFPHSPLAGDAAEKRVLIEKSRERAATELVRSRWFYHLGRKARAAAKTMTVAQATEFATSQLSEEIRAAVLDDVHKRISAAIEGIDAYWNERKKSRFQVSSYGHGTWLIGEEGAYAGVGDKAEEEKKEPQSELAAERAALEAKIKRFLENQSRARQALSQADAAEDRELFWKSFPVGSRAQWIISFYAENGGDLEVRPRPHVRNCPGCAGTGVREVIHSGGVTSESGPALYKCSICLGIGIIRRVHYR